MFGKLEMFQMAAGMATHAAERQSVLAQNIANADTPGYRAKDVASFSATFRAVEGGQGLRSTRAGHLLGPQDAQAQPRLFDVSGDAAPNGNTVSLEQQMMKGAETKAQHDMAMAVYKSSMTILRHSIGR